MDRHALLERHSPRVRGLDPRSPLQVGNGSLAFTADLTGLQTFPEAYPAGSGGGPVPGHDDGAAGTRLGTLSSWGWRTCPVAGPQRLDLGRVSLWMRDGIDLSDVEDVDQHLDLASGLLTSRFTVRGARYEVTTAVHPEQDELAVEVRRVGTTPSAAAVEPEHFGIDLLFASGVHAMPPPEEHSTQVHLTFGLDGSEYVIDRHVEQTRYTATVRTPGAALGLTSEHHVRFVAEPGSDSVALLCHLAPARIPGLPHRHSATMSDVVAASSRWWNSFWHDGADLACGDTSCDEPEGPWAAEIEQCVVLSQYLAAVSCAGDGPPS